MTVGTTANATNLGTAAATSEATGENKSTDDDEKGELLMLGVKDVEVFVKIPHILDGPVFLTEMWLFASKSIFSDDRAAQSLLNKLIRSNLVKNTNQVEVLQKDPNSPLYSVRSFEELRL